MAQRPCLWSTRIVCPGPTGATRMWAGRIEWQRFFARLARRRARVAPASPHRSTHGRLKDRGEYAAHFASSYRILQTGFRFSAKAAAPSFASSDPQTELMSDDPRRIA